jgi:hypothetical protein
LVLNKGGLFTDFKETGRVELSEELDQFRHHPGPACLVAGPETGAVVGSSLTAW